MHRSWYDHTDMDLEALLKSVGIAKSQNGSKHGVACNCISCQGEAT